MAFNHSNVIFNTALQGYLESQEGLTAKEVSAICGSHVRTCSRWLSDFMMAGQMTYSHGRYVPTAGTLRSALIAEQRKVRQWKDKYVERGRFLESTGARVRSLLKTK